MNRQEIEHAITLLDDSVERLAEMNDSAGCELIAGEILENLQEVIAKLERWYCYAEGASEEDDSEEAEDF